MSIILDVRNSRPQGRLKLRICNGRIMPLKSGISGANFEIGTSSKSNIRFGEII